MILSLLVSPLLETWVRVTWAFFFSQVIALLMEYINLPPWHRKCIFLYEKCNLSCTFFICVCVGCMCWGGVGGWMGGWGHLSVEIGRQPQASSFTAHHPTVLRQGLWLTFWCVTLAVLLHFHHLYIGGSRENQSLSPVKMTQTQHLLHLLYLCYISMCLCISFPSTCSSLHLCFNHLCTSFLQFLRVDFLCDTHSLPLVFLCWWA